MVNQVWRLWVLMKYGEVTDIVEDSFLHISFGLEYFNVARTADLSAVEC